MTSVRPRPFDMSTLRRLVPSPAQADVQAQARDCLRVGPIQALTWSFEGGILEASGVVREPAGHRYQAEIDWDGELLAGACSCELMMEPLCPHQLALALQLVKLNPWRQEPPVNWQVVLDMALPASLEADGEARFVYRLDVRSRPPEPLGHLRLRLSRARYGRRKLGQETPYPASRLKGLSLEGLPIEERGLLSWLTPLQGWVTNRDKGFASDPRYLDIPPQLVGSTLRCLTRIPLAFMGEEGEQPLQVSSKPLYFSLGLESARNGAIRLIGRMTEQPLVDNGALVRAATPSSSPAGGAETVEAQAEAADSATGSVSTKGQGQSEVAAAAPSHHDSRHEQAGPVPGASGAGTNAAGAGPLGVGGPEFRDAIAVPHPEEVFPDLVVGESPCYALIDQVFYRVENLDRPELWAMSRCADLLVPYKDMPVFLEKFFGPLQSAALLRQVELNAAMPEVIINVQPTPLLTLEEEEGKLLAFLSFRYGPNLVASATTPRAVEELEVGDRRLLLHRDLTAEEQLELHLEQAGLTLAAPGRFEATGEAALKFLVDQVPRLLAAEWSVEGEDRLERYRPARNPLRIRGVILTGLNWFELQLEATYGDERMPLSELFHAWRAGRRFVRFGNGELAMLPQEWMERNRALLSALMGDKRDHKNRDVDSLNWQSGEEEKEQWRLPLHLAPLVETLADDDTQLEVPPAWRKLIDKLKSFGGITPAPYPVGLHAEMREYQRKGLDWLCFLRDHGLAGVLADDMGLGKTLQTLALLQLEKETQPVHRVSLVVAPTSVLFNWLAEARRFTPELKVKVLHGPSRHAFIEDLRSSDLVVTSYALLRRDHAIHQEMQYHYVILDEAQWIKNPESLTAASARALQSNHRLTLTGTPIENRLTELWSQFAFLLPGMLPDLRTFMNDYVMPIERDQDQDRLSELRRRLHPFILRRLKEEVASELPPRTDNVLYCELEGSQRQLYDAVLKAARERVRKAIEEKGSGQARITALDALLKLRQICCHPKLVRLPEALGVEVSSKQDLFIETLQEVLSEGHRVLVFSQFVEMLSLLRDELIALKIPFEYLDGRTRDRQERVDRFNAGSAPVFLISLKAGGTGLNLATADYVIHFDPWWNPAVEDQATDRAYRIGQVRPVFSYKLIARNTVEEKILVLQQRKRELARGLLDSTGELEKELSVSDLEYLFADDDRWSSDD